MPVRDAAATLGRAVDSLLAQTDNAWELIAVDDGSTDASPAILTALAGQDRRIRVVHGEGRGLVAALRTGLTAARGSLIARLDADDVCAPERLARQRAHMDAHPGVGLVACRVQFGGDARAAAGFARYVQWSNGLLTHAEIALARFVEAPLVHPSVLFRRELIERWGSYRDGDFPEAFYRLKAAYLARWLAAHNRHHPGVVVWGAGRVSRRRARYLTEHGVRIDAYVDIDPRKVGRPLDGRPVLAAEQLPPAGTVLSCRTWRRSTPGTRSRPVCGATGIGRAPTTSSRPEAVAKLSPAPGCPYAPGGWHRATVQYRLSCCRRGAEVGWWRGSRT